MRYLLILLTLLLVGCATDCSKCQVAIKTKILTPTIACYQPKPLEDLRNEFLSTDTAKTEGELLEIVATNEKMLEARIQLWEGYRNCVDKTIQVYKEIQNATSGDDKTK